MIPLTEWGRMAWSFFGETIICIGNIGSNAGLKRIHGRTIYPYLKNTNQKNHEQLTPFHTIRILTRCQISLHQDNSCTFHVDEPDDMAKWIDYQVENDELIIQTKPMHYGFLLLSDSYPKIHITCTNLNGIHILDKAYVATKE